MTPTPCDAGIQHCHRKATRTVNVHHIGIVHYVCQEHLNAAVTKVINRWPDSNIALLMIEEN